MSTGKHTNSVYAFPYQPYKVLFSDPIGTDDGSCLVCDILGSQSWTDTWWMSLSISDIPLLYWGPSWLIQIQSNDHNRRIKETYLHATWPKWPSLDPTPVWNTQQGKLTAREVFFTVTFNSLIIPLYTTNITHKQKYHHRQPIISESATRNNLELNTPINTILISCSSGTVGIQAQQHQKEIWKLANAIWRWARFNGTHTAFKYLSIHLQLPYLQRKIRTWKNTENISCQ